MVKAFVASMVRGKKAAARLGCSGISRIRLIY